MGVIRLVDVREKTTELIKELKMFDPAVVAVLETDNTFSFGNYLKRHMNRGKGRIIPVVSYPHQSTAIELPWDRLYSSNNRITVCRLYGTPRQLRKLVDNLRNGKDEVAIQHCSLYEQPKPPRFEWQPYNPPPL